ncbi:HCO3- transporter family domain-containing protein [Ditylenchus destructor]|nr:HCO3- transporter family domain-containing protein [Ditylenchus destructor]
MYYKSFFQDFNSIAYSARDKSHLIEGIDKFLDGSVVIPPGEVDSKRLLSTDEIKKALKRRKLEAEMSTTKKGANELTVEEGDAAQSTANGPGSTDPAKRPPSSVGSSMGKGGSTGHSSSRSLPSGKQQYTCFNGMISDLRNRFPLYWSDIRDAANFQCLTSVVFMFFASFAPAITFGGLMGKYTNEKMGTIETLFAQCICGIIWGLFSAQPLLIMSATGPVLIFEASLYTFCENLNLDFLTVRLYAGMFIFMISVCITAVDGSRLLVYVTRFTEDIFATLISAIFIAESLHFVWHTFQENPVEDYRYYQEAHVNCDVKGESAMSSHPTPIRAMRGDLLPMTSDPLPIPFTVDGATELRHPNHTAAAAAAFNAALASVKAAASSGGPSAAVAQQLLMVPRRIPCSDAEPNTALLTAIIVFATFILAFMLKKLRDSFYLGRHLRRALGDFGVLIAIALVAVLVHVCLPDPYLKRLEMPDHINFTNPEQRGHGLIVTGIFDVESWYGIFVALVAALLVFILLFVETEITELLLMRKERGCRKGSGMNWDLVLVGFCALLCSIFGLPWMCAAAVQSLAHCSSLTVLKKKAPGARPEVDHVIEQRVTTVAVSLLIGLIAFAGSYLRLAMASLFGVFLYLGIMNLSGVQLVHRVVLFLIPEKYLPATPYTEQMSIWRMHLYTWIQIGCLFLVYAVKYFKKTALAFPFVLMLFIILRHTVLPKIFSEKELKAIDGEQLAEDDEWMERDFYESAHIPA